MAFTKRQIIEQAFEEIGLASYVFDITPDQLQSALRRLDLMVASWQAMNIQIGYPLPASPDNSNIDEQIQTSLNNNEALVLNLAIRLAPAYGKSLSPDTKTTAKALYNQLLIEAAMPYEQQFVSTLPLGAGFKRTDQVFVNVPDLNPLIVENNDQMLFKNS
jgi:hypothetical protein